MTVRILRGDCRRVLKTLPDESVHCVVTSPPYWGLRDYGLPPSMWGGDLTCEHALGEVWKMHRGGANGGGAATVGRDQSARYAVKELATGQTCEKCGAWFGCLGLEPTPQLFVEHLVEVFREVRRVLRADGTAWLNLGDSYAGSGGQSPQYGGIFDGRRRAEENICLSGRAKPVGGLKTKDMVGIPWRVAFALQADGWWLRQDIIWNKPNPMPESVTDRCTKSHEYLFLLAKSERYYFDAEAIAEACTQDDPRMHNDFEPQRLERDFPGHQSRGGGPLKKSGNKTRRQSSERGCPGKNGKNQASSVPWQGTTRNKRDVWTVTTQPFKEAHFATFPPALIEPCILAGSPRGGVVLDPFGGAGTTGLVADRHGRDAILIELNPEYAAMAERRIRGESPLFAEVEA